LLNVMLYTMVIRRVTNLAGIADQVSLGNMEAGEFKTHSKDELGVLTEAMGRMKASLVQAMKMLEGCRPPSSLRFASLRAPTFATRRGALRVFLRGARRQSESSPRPTLICVHPRALS